MTRICGREAAEKDDQEDQKEDEFVSLEDNKDEFASKEDLKDEFVSKQDLSPEPQVRQLITKNIRSC